MNLPTGRQAAKADGQPNKKNDKKSEPATSSQTASSTQEISFTKLTFQMRSEAKQTDSPNTNVIKK